MITPNPSENAASSLETLRAFAQREQLESPETYLAAIEAVVPVLSQQETLPHLADLPTIIIPDLHARREMLVAILSVRIADGPLAGELVFDLLQQGRINVVCVGDIMHSEDRSKWVINRDGECSPELLDKEMVRSLGAGAMVMYLKQRFPNHFYCLRGNHDDMDAEMGPYRKFVGVKRDERDELVLIDGRPVLTSDKGESGIVRDWVVTREGWGQPFLAAWTRFEHALPLFIQGCYYVISHTLPLAPLSAEKLHDPARPHELVLELTFSRGVNRVAIEETLEDLGLRDRVQRWFYGHSQVSSKKNGGKYEEALDGLLVRLNNPSKHVFAYVPASKDERRFDPTQDVYIKMANEEEFVIV